MKRKIPAALLSIAAVMIAAWGVSPVHAIVDDDDAELIDVSIEDIDAQLAAGGGSFQGRVVAEDLDDGRQRRLLEDVLYTDVYGRDWPVPAGTVWDGASIPQQVWSAGMSPFVGKYRNAALVHDYYCQQRTRSDTDTHYVFYEIMRQQGTERQTAITMYEAVARFGPRWQTQVEISLNGQLGTWGKFKDWFGHTVRGQGVVRRTPLPTTTKTVYCEYEYDEAELDRILRAVEEGAMDIETARQRMDALKETATEVCE